MQSKNKSTSCRDSVDEFSRKLGDAASQFEKEAERLVNYINAEVVPAVREQSSVGLRKAAEKLAEFADYLDDRKRRQSS